MSGGTECRLAPGGCGDIYCPACRTARAFPKLDHRSVSILGGKARVRDGALARAAQATFAARWAAKTPEERREAMRHLWAGRDAKKANRWPEAKWPFPHGPKMSKAEAAAKARAALAAKLARTKLARAAASRASRKR